MSIATFILEKIAEFATTCGMDFLKNRKSKFRIQQVDEEIRTYLKDKLSDYEYEKIDRYLQEENLYGLEQIELNVEKIDGYMENIVEDFYLKNPRLKSLSDIYTPKLENAIKLLFGSIDRQLTNGETIIYNKTLEADIKNRNLHKELHLRLESIEETLRSIPARSLTYQDAFKIYRTLLEIIYKGDFICAESLIELFKNQVQEQDRYLSTTLLLYCKAFCCEPDELERICKQLIRENPDEEQCKQVIIGLIKSENYICLKWIKALVKDNELLNTICELANENWNLVIDYIADSDYVLKKEYKDQECALWVLAEFLRLNGFRRQAVSVYDEIEQQFPSIWGNWKKQQNIAVMQFTKHIVIPHGNVNGIECSVQKMFEFSSFFNLLSDSKCKEYAESLLDCAKFLSIDQFDCYYNQLPTKIKNLSCVKEHWYAVHLFNEPINLEEFEAYCFAHGCTYLWSAYLQEEACRRPEYVIEKIENNLELLQNDISAIIAYYNSLQAIQGHDKAFEIITHIRISDDLKIPCDIYFAEIIAEYSIESASSYLDEAADMILNATNDISFIHLISLTDLLTHLGNWKLADAILEKYQHKDYSIMFQRLRVLIVNDIRNSECESIIECLQTDYCNCDFWWYGKGRLAEEELLGAGLESFEKAFSLNNSVRNAVAVLIARINRNILIEDEVLLFSTKHTDYYLLYLAGLMYYRLGKYNIADNILLQGLVICNDGYHEGLYGLFTNSLLRRDGHEDIPQHVILGTCCVLTSLNNEKEIKVWLHNDSIYVPEKGSNFAGYVHLAANDPLCFRLLGLKQEDNVCIDGEEYILRSINNEMIIATRFCMEKLLEHGAMKQISVSEDRISDLFDEIRKINEPHRLHVQKVIEAYKTAEPGLTLDLFAHGVGVSYYKAVFALLLDKGMPFWSGIDGNKIKVDCILTPSTIAVLSALHIQPPTKDVENLKIYIPNSLKQELELQAREQRDVNTTAVMTFSEDGHPIMIENTEASKREMNVYFSFLNMWMRWADSLGVVTPEEYPDDIRAISADLGISNVEAIVYAKKKQYIICSDDLLLRKYMNFSGIQTATTIDVLIALDYSFEDVVECASKLIDYNYRSGISLNLFLWISETFKNADNEDKLAEYAIKIIDLFEKIMENIEIRSDLFYIIRQIHDSKIEIHDTLTWIINSTIYKYHSPIVEAK